MGWRGCGAAACRGSAGRCPRPTGIDQDYPYHPLQSDLRCLWNDIIDYVCRMRYLGEFIGGRVFRLYLPDALRGALVADLGGAGS